MRRGDCDMTLQYRKYPCLLPTLFLTFLGCYSKASLLPPSLSLFTLPPLHPLTCLVATAQSFSPSFFLLLLSLLLHPPTLVLSGCYSTKLLSLLLPSFPLSLITLPLSTLPPPTNFSGCCNTEASSSTARALAIMDSPGLETVHCWSRVRSLVDCVSRARKIESHSTH